MSKKTLRNQNKCKDCGYTWYPRGKDLSNACPKCGGRNVGYAGPGIFAVIAVIAVIYFFVHQDSGKTGSDTATSSSIKPATTEQTAPSQPRTSGVEPLSSATVTAAPNPPGTGQKHTSGIDVSSPATTTTAPPESTSQKHTSGAETSHAETAPEDPRNKVFTDDEIDKLEEEKQYHGDDPIVRARMGLPSRTTKKLEH